MSEQATPTAPMDVADYPCSDGKPMGETGYHVNAMLYLYLALHHFYTPRRSDFLVTGEQFWYYGDGPRVVVSPDIMVVLGVRPGPRRIYHTLSEGGVIPSAIFEMLSASTAGRDENEKYDLYESLGVREYFTFDPDIDDPSLALKGYRLNRTAYRRIRPKNGTIESELGFGLRAEPIMIRLVDLATGKFVLTPDEAADEAERAADQSARQAEMARVEAARQLDAARTEAERQAEAARQAEASRMEVAQSEAARQLEAVRAEAVAATERAAQLQVELERLRAMLASQGGAP